MARRSGKASRQSRQRRAQRAAARPAAPRTPPAPPDAFEAADSAARAAGTTPAPLPTTPRPSGSRQADPRFQVAGPSRLSDRAIADYHYVMRDLRNIAVLVGVLAILLALSTVGMRALGIGQV